MHGRKLASGLILCFLAACHPKEGEGAPLFPAVGPGGSFSGANSKSYEREVNLGRLEISRGVSKSQAVTLDNGGYKNGGTTSVAKSKAVSRELSLGGLDIGSTVTRTEARTNGAVSRGIAQEVNIGKLGIDTSLSRDNRKNGFGLHREPGGDVSLNVGALNVDLSRNARPQSVDHTNAEVTAQGKNAQATSSSSSHTQQQNYGRVGVTKTSSQSTALGHTQLGRTQANTAGGTGRTATQAATAGGTRFRRGVAYSSNGRNKGVLKDNGSLSGPANMRTQNTDAKHRHQRHLFHAESPKFTSFVSFKNSSFGLFSKPKQPNKEATEISDLLSLNNSITLSTSAASTAGIEQHGRTFLRLITDLFGNLVRNRYCETVSTVPPTPLISPSFLPRLLSRPAYRPPAVMVSPPTRMPAIYCCIVCNAYVFYGPPPCVRHHSGNAFFNFGRTSVAYFANTDYVTINEISSYFG